MPLRIVCAVGLIVVLALGVSAGFAHMSWWLPERALAAVEGPNPSASPARQAVTAQGNHIPSNDAPRIVPGDTHSRVTPESSNTEEPCGDEVWIAATDHRLYLPLQIGSQRSPEPTPTPTSTPSPPSSSIILAERQGGLELVSAPVTFTLTVGHVAYLPVEVQGYYRPITVTAQTLIHTFVEDSTPSEPWLSAPLQVRLLEEEKEDLKLQTLRMRPHPLALTFIAGSDVVTVTLSLEPAVQFHTPIFGIHALPFWGGLPPPFELVYGPDCGSCTTTEGDPPGSTRERNCAREQDPCGCHYLQWVYNPEEDEHTRRRAPDMQRYASQFLRSVGGWSNVEIEPGEYLWTALDWLLGETSLSPEERDYSPLFTGIMYNSLGWVTCPAYTNPDGSSGFFDVDNAYLLEQYRSYVRTLTSRYTSELRYIEIGNEPAAEFYLCPCAPPGDPPCDAVSGPNQPICMSGPDSAEFVATYGDLLYTATDIAAEEIATANPEALLITGAMEVFPTVHKDLTQVTEYMITRGLLNDHDNVVIGIHQSPYFYPPLWMTDENGDPIACGYFQTGHDVYWLPDGCETAPPLEGTVETPRGEEPVRELWRLQDSRVDVSSLLHKSEDLGVLDRFYMFDTELHAGFHEGDSTTPAREGLAGLRIGSINAHQRVLGTQYIFAPSDPEAYNLMVKNLAGVTPVYAWDAPLMDAGYSGVIYKLFTRGDEDIIAAWSNAETELDLTLTLSSQPTDFRQVTLTSFIDEGGPLSINDTDLSVPPATIPVRPLEEFHFLSVISDRPGFGWLLDISVP